MRRSLLTSVVTRLIFLQCRLGRGNGRLRRARAYGSTGPLRQYPPGACVRTLVLSQEEEEEEEEDEEQGEVALDEEEGDDDSKDEL